MQNKDLPLPSSDSPDMPEIGGRGQIPQEKPDDEYEIVKGMEHEIGRCRPYNDRRCLSPDSIQPEEVEETEG